MRPCAGRPSGRLSPISPRGKEERKRRGEWRGNRVEKWAGWKNKQTRSEERQRKRDWKGKEEKHARKRQNGGPGRSQAGAPDSASVDIGGLAFLDGPGRQGPKTQGTKKPGSVPAFEDRASSPRSTAQRHLPERWAHCSAAAVNSTSDDELSAVSQES